MKIKWGALMVDGRGKIGGQVASKNRAGAYMRNKVTPINRNSARQQQVRQALAAISSGWSNLTQPERDSWNSAVSSYSKTDVFGDTRLPTGKNLYTKLNFNLNQIGRTLIDVAPLPVDFPILNFLNLDIAIDTISGAFTFESEIQNYQDLGPNDVIQIEATPPLSAGVSFVESEYRLLPGNPVPSAGEQFSFANQYELVFGKPAGGSKVFLRVYAVSGTSGQKGIAISASRIVRLA